MTYLFSLVLGSYGATFEARTRLLVAGAGQLLPPVKLVHPPTLNCAENDASLAQAR